MSKNKSPSLPEDSFNGNLTALPKDVTSDNVSADSDLVATPMDYGTMNAEDAKESGYTDEKGQAVSMAKGDIPGGRSSPIHPRNKEQNDRLH
jgi:hypothetical protein